MAHIELQCSVVSLSHDCHVIHLWYMSHDP